MHPTKKTLIPSQWRKWAAVVIVTVVAFATLFHLLAPRARFASVLPDPISPIYLGMPYKDFTGKFADLAYRDARSQGRKRIEVSFGKQADYKFFDEWSIYFDDADHIYRLVGTNTQLTNDDEKELFEAMEEIIEDLDDSGLDEDYARRLQYTKKQEGAYADALFRNKGTDPYDTYMVAVSNDINRRSQCLSIEIVTTRQ